MPEHTPYQKKLIGRYYDRRDEIMLAKLQEIVTELYLVETDRKREQLWKRVGQAMQALKIPPGLVDHILTQRKVEVLARHVRGWLKAAAQPPRRKSQT